MTWFDRQASSHHVQLAAVAVLSGVTVAGLIYGTQALRRKEAVQELKASIPELSETHRADMVRFGKNCKANKQTGSRLISSVKLTDFGAALRLPDASREDERVSALARRAQQGDYDEGLTTKTLRILESAC